MEGEGQRDCGAAEEDHQNRGRDGDLGIGCRDIGVNCETDNITVFINQPELEGEAEIRGCKCGFKRPRRVVVQKQPQKRSRELSSCTNQDGECIFNRGLRNWSKDTVTIKSLAVRRRAGLETWSQRTIDAPRVSRSNSLLSRSDVLTGQG